MSLNPRYGKVGMSDYPYYFFLEVFGPIIESLGYVTFLGIALPFAAIANSRYWRAGGMVSKLTGANAWGAMERPGITSKREGGQGTFFDVRTGGAGE